MKCFFASAAVAIAAMVVSSCGQTSRRLEVANDEFSSSLILDGCRISGAGFVDLRTGDTLTPVAQKPLFEFCIDGKIVTSSDPFWRYKRTDVRELNNGGSVFSYTFTGRGPMSGLTFVWEREIFGKDAFLRERMLLKSSKDHRFTNLAGANHFVFPRYSFIADGDVDARELRIATFRPSRSFPDHHMFHPDSVDFSIGNEEVQVKGPFLTLDVGSYKLLTSYEHASQDNSWMKPMERKEALGDNDASQGVEGDLVHVGDNDLWFVATIAALDGGSLNVGQSIRRGGYLDGERIPSDSWYETVWSTISILPDGSDVNVAIGDYLFNKITENKESRVADFYYNTWGMQRNQRKDSLYLVMNEQRLREEIMYAHECGVNTFVFDDGWAETFGHWVDNPVRLPGGLKPLVALLDSLGMRTGAWLSLAGAGKETERTKEHPEWLVRDKKGKPIAGQWKNPVYDLVGDVHNAILADLKALTDEGVRFFKWDSINTFSSSLCGQGHGDESNPVKERIDRYNYLLPFVVTQMMRELREYCPDVVIEIDLTEPERALMGLQILQEGKYYFINNGASRYNDYSAYRTRSVRSTINEYADFIPQELFTYAYYPHDMEPDLALEYNATSALSAGHGIWGNLALMTPEQRKRVKSLFDKAMLVLPEVSGRLVERNGRIDDSPEIYLQRNPKSGYALLTVFGPEPLKQNVDVEVAPEQVLGVLGSPFSIGGNGVSIPLAMAGTPACASAFIIGNAGGGARVLSSTGKLESVSCTGGVLTVEAASASDICVRKADGKVQDVHLEAGERRSF